MDNKKYQKLRAKIIEVCPDILELKFGCKILRYKKHPDERKNFYIK